MKFKMKNLGLLDEAEVELGDFTIFCGENNTGKTYAAYAIYGFLSHGAIVDFCISVTKDFESKFRVETNKLMRMKILLFLIEPNLFFLVVAKHMLLC